MIVIVIVITIAIDSKDSLFPILLGQFVNYNNSQNS